MWCKIYGSTAQLWLCTIKRDLKPFNPGLHSAVWRAADRSSWQCAVEPVMLPNESQFQQSQYLHL